MDLSKITLLFATLFAVLINTVSGLHCYRCHSSEAGCGKELNIRLQRWFGCPSPGRGGGENFCVKVIEKRGSENYMTRECLMTLRQHSEHRQKMPTIQRHGYCSPGRNDDPNHPYDKNTIYCFCNDWNGCNPASTVRATVTLTAVIGLIASMIHQVL